MEELHKEIENYILNCIPEKDFTSPKKSKQLAEIIGIILGDGGLTKYQLKITLNKETESEYINYVVKLLEKTFKTKVQNYYFRGNRKDKVCNVTISGKNFIKILEKLGLKKGNKIKNQVGVPRWIIQNQEYSKLCLRGLVDTDGGIYYHKHKTKGFSCFNLGLSYCSHSRPLIIFVNQLLLNLGFNTKCRGKQIYLYRYDEIIKYFDIIGTSNSRNLKRLQSFNKIKMERYSSG